MGHFIESIMKIGIMLKKVLSVRIMLNVDGFYFHNSPKIFVTQRLEIQHENLCGLKRRDQQDHHPRKDIPLGLHLGHQDQDRILDRDPSWSPSALLRRTSSRERQNPN